MLVIFEGSGEHRLTETQERQFRAVRAAMEVNGAPPQGDEAVFERALYFAAMFARQVIVCELGTEERADKHLAAYNATVDG